MNETIQAMEAQLIALYAEKEYLQEALGFSDAEKIVEVIQSLTSQLELFYAEKEISQNQ